MKRRTLIVRGSTLCPRYARDYVMVSLRGSAMNLFITRRLVRGLRYSRDVLIYLRGTRLSALSTFDRAAVCIRAEP